MQGSAKKNLLMFNKLCGEHALRKVVLVTTMWENLRTQDEGENREKELRNTDEFWGWMSTRGSRIERHTNDAQSAKRLLEMFIPADKRQPPEKVALEIQKEMAEENKLLKETKAGEAVCDSITKEEIRIHQTLEEYQQSAREAMLERDSRRHQDLEEIMAGMRQQEDLLIRNRETLSADMKEMVKAKYDQAFADLLEDERWGRLSIQHSIRSESNTEIGTSQTVALDMESSAWVNMRPSLALPQRHASFKSNQRLSLSLRGRHCSFIGPAYTKS